jgi:chaperonin GroES
MDRLKAELQQSNPETSEESTEENGMAKKPNLIPLGDRVVLQRDDAEGTTAGGIVLPDSAQDKPQRGKVIAVGDGHVKSDGSKVQLTVKAGDHVLFTSYAGDEISVGDDDFLLLRESDILATF